MIWSSFHWGTLFIWIHVTLLPAGVELLPLLFHTGSDKSSERHCYVLSIGIHLIWHVFIEMHPAISKLCSLDQSRGGWGLPPPHSKKVTDSNFGWGSVRVPQLPPTVRRRALDRLIGDSKLCVDVNVRVNGCPYVPCDELARVYCASRIGSSPSPHNPHEWWIYVVIHFVHPSRPKAATRDLTL